MEFKEFIKTHSALANDFIDDFFELRNPEEKRGFVIDLDKVCQWLQTKKGALKKTLINTYIKDVDYVINKKNKTKQQGGMNDEQILLTPKCFKLLTMQSKTKKADEVREYYYMLEELIDQYKEYIIEGLKGKVKKLKNNQKHKK